MINNAFIRWLSYPKTTEQWRGDIARFVRQCLGRDAQDGDDELYRSVGFTPVDPKVQAMDAAEFADEIDRICRKGDELAARMDQEYERQYGAITEKRFRVWPKS